jgi:hypothetical protein
MATQARTAFLAGEKLDGHSKVSEELAPPHWHVNTWSLRGLRWVGIPPPSGRGNCCAQHLDTLSL